MHLTAQFRHQNTLNWINNNYQYQFYFKMQFFSKEDVFNQSHLQFSLFELERKISVDDDQNLLKMKFQQEIQEQSLLPKAYPFEETTQLSSNNVPNEEGERKKKVDYEKNICGNIAKKVVDYLLSSTYRSAVDKLCKQNGCSYDQLKLYYGEQAKKVFGITLLSILISPQREQEMGIKRVFRAFLKWFLRNKYMSYLLKYGKMQEKDKYIQFKNKYLLYIQEQDSLLNSQSSLNRLE